jgi:hypothetical protein
MTPLRKRACRKNRLVVPRFAPHKPTMHIRLAKRIAPAIRRVAKENNRSAAKEVNRILFIYLTSLPENQTPKRK